MTTFEPGARLVFTHGFVRSPRSRAFFASSPAPTMTEGFEVLVQLVIAAITSCTNTSNPSVLIGAGLVAKKANEKGLRPKPWVKTSLAPGSKVVMEYYERANLIEPLEALGFHLVGYGCTTCIGNSGPLPEPISEAINDNDLVVAAVLSGNRNFEGRVNADVRANYLASPPLVVAYALAGSLNVDHSAIASANPRSAQRSKASGARRCTSTSM